MLRPVLAALLVAICTAGPSAQETAAYVHSNAGSAWGQEVYYTDVMTAVFGGDWTDAVFETVDVQQLFSPERVFVYLEGSDSMANELEAFLEAHRKTIEAWVRKGGRLFVNSAPNEGDGMLFPFDVALVFDDDYISGSGTACGVDPHDAIFVGPAVVLERVFSGSSASHAFVEGKKLVPILRDDKYRTTLVKARQAKGLAFFGGLTTPNYWWPDVPAEAMRANSLCCFAGAQLEPDQLALSIKLGWPQGADPWTDSLKLVVKDIPFGEIEPGGLAVEVDVDGFVMTGVLDAQGRSTTVIANATTKFVVKTGRKTSLVVTQTHDEIASHLASTFLVPLDTAIETELPVTIRLGTRTFTATVPVSFKGKAKTTTGLVKSL